MYLSQIFPIIHHNPIYFELHAYKFTLTIFKIPLGVLFLEAVALELFYCFIFCDQSAIKCFLSVLTCLRVIIISLIITDLVRTRCEVAETFILYIIYVLFSWLLSLFSLVDGTKEVHCSWLWGNHPSTVLCWYVRTLWYSFVLKHEEYSIAQKQCPLKSLICKWVKTYIYILMIMLCTVTGAVR